MVLVNVIIVSDEGDQDMDLEMPAVPRVGDALAFEREGGFEDTYEVRTVTFRRCLDGNVHVVVEASEFDM